MVQQALARLVDGHHLARQEAADLMRALMSGEVPPSSIAAVLVALRMKGETVDEITGFAETMRSLATPITPSRRPLVDTCGTGGDHSGTFNISTCAAFVVAGSGAAVAKHGNRSASSKCGSADVLEALGVNLELAPERVAAAIDEVGIGFLFARNLHAAMRHVGPVRAELKLRTVFNVLGPLTNPAGADAQVMGVYDERLLEPLAKVLGALGARHAFVVAGSDGLDELTLTGESRLAEWRDGGVHLHQVTPERFGLQTATRDALQGGDAAESAAILRGVLAGEPGPRRDIVLLNAAPALVAAGLATSLEDGLEQAAASIDSGAAQARLDALIAFA